MTVIGLIVTAKLAVNVTFNLVATLSSVLYLAVLAQQSSAWHVYSSDVNVIQDMPKVTGYWLSDIGIG